MLRKVMKYEYRAIGMQLLPLCGLALATALGMRLVWMLCRLLPWQNVVDFAQGFTTSITTVLLLALVLLSFVIVVHRFYASCTGNEAYLTFTLPVKTGALLAGRVFTGVSGIFGALLVAVGSGLIFYSGLPQQKAWSFNEVYLFSAGVDGQKFSVNVGDLPTTLRAGFVALVILLVLVGILFILFQCYTAIAIGSRFGTSRALFSVVFYFVLNWIQGFAVLLLAGIPVGIFMGAKGGVAGVTHWFLAMSAQTMMQEAFRLMMLLFGIVALCCLLVSGLYYLVCRQIFTKSLNLE